MSGGERKKRISHGTGWEEAGAEFYQECYPGAEIDLDALPKDPHYFATLLPSKQTRVATNRRTRDRKSTFKRRTSTRSRHNNTMNQNTMTNDIHVAMMPDLSENLANEETTWEEMMLIKSMPINMTQKKEIKAKLLSADTFRLQGLKQFKWRRRKFWEYLKVRRKEFYKTIELWRKCLITIEGNFGTGVVAFFFFVKWLMFLNLTVTVLIVCFIIVPTLLMQDSDSDPCSPLNDSFTYECCSHIYIDTWNNFTLTPFTVAEGNGWLESSYMFYGIYPNSVLENVLLNYNLPVAYIATVLGYFLLSLFAIIKKATHGFKERLVEQEGHYYRYCTLIFSGWDFCIYNEQSAKIKHQAIYNEVKECLETEIKEEEKKHRTRNEYCRLLSIRLFVNSVILIIFIAASSLIFYTFQYSINELQKDTDDEIHRLLLEFAPYLCIVSLNLIVPTILNYFVILEGYSPLFSLRITFFRSIILRLTSLGVLLASFYSLVRCRTGNEETCVSNTCRKPVCWETYVGQQIYKLLILDIVSNALITFLINFPRMLIAKHLKCKLARFIGAQEFELPKHVLDVVYSQTLVWFGSFYAPLLPALATVLFFLVFYVKKFACLVNSSPSVTIYRASRSDSMFMSVLLVSFTVAVIPWAYTMSEIEPSRLCGPFRGRPNVWSLLEEVYSHFPDWILFTIKSLMSSHFIIPSILVLLFTLYYYYIIANANKQMVLVLKKQLVLEGHDKQFLLNRLSAFIKQQQERHKAVARSVVPHSSN